MESEIIQVKELNVVLQVTNHHLKIVVMWTSSFCALGPLGTPY